MKARKADKDSLTLFFHVHSLLLAIVSNKLREHKTISGTRTITDELYGGSVLRLRTTSKFIIDALCSPQVLQQKTKTREIITDTITTDISTHFYIPTVCR